MELMLAKSKAGHDKNHIYVVSSVEGDMVCLVNGGTKPLDNPKRKKRMHVQPIIHLPKEINDLVEGVEVLNNELVVKLLDLYARRK